MKKNILITGKSGFIGRNIEGGRAYKGKLWAEIDIINQMKGIKGIVHLAAMSSKIACNEDPEVAVFSNIFGTYNVLSAALKSRAWVLFISTYQINEQHLYGLSKLVGEELCRLFSKRGLQVKILRLPIVYGPGDRSYKVVTKFIKLLQLGVEPNIDTNKKFYFLYVKDAAKIIEKEVEVIEGKIGEKISLHKLKNIIKECI